MNRHTLWITRTGVFLALLIVLQAATTSLGNTLVTGSVVNMLLVLSVMLLGLSSGTVIAVLSPVLAKLLGIGPLWSLIPFIIAGNLSLILVWHFAGRKAAGGDKEVLCAVWLGAAAAKFSVLYLGIVKFAVPFLLKMPEKQAAVVSAMFSYPQLATALAGGLAAAGMLPVLRRALKD